MKILRTALAALLLVVSTGCGARTVKYYDIKVVKEYPHDVTSYTQGLFFNGGDLYESTGEYGKSTFRKVDLETGKALKKFDFNKKYFVEGSVMLDGKLFILTWLNKVLFVYDAKTLEYKQTYSYPREGWGLTTDGKSLIASDGSSKIYFLDSSLKLQKTLNVTMNGRAVRYLNELEWIDGKIWANVYTTDTIVVIDPKSGEVESIINCAGLLDQKLVTQDTDVLNGIAVNPADGKIYLTGKNWPKLFEIKLVESR